MAGFLDEFIKSYGPEVSQQLASNLGINKKTALQIIPQVVPLVLGGLQRQKEQFGGAPRVDHILDKYGSADVLKNIGGLFASKVNDTSVDAKLGGLLGDSGVQATDMIANKFKLDPSIAMKIIPMLAPIILGALTHKRDNTGLGSSGIGALLDQDGDGSILDDVAGFLTGSLSGSGSSSTGNVLGSILGGLFGKKK
jgi:hypothetical protein